MPKGRHFRFRPLLRSLTGGDALPARPLMIGKTSLQLHVKGRLQTLVLQD